MSHHEAFEPLESRHIGALNVDYLAFRHTGSGARHLHIDADDANNGFMVAFPTLPLDSTGVAHILEHTTLCGSERFPVRDPFFMMLRRSLNSFMNAMTSSDFTAYPFATKNRKDYDNLLAVYLDAVFFPLLDELDFAQEGHRLELEGEGADAPLVYKGVVFNEMKGAMSSPTTQLWFHLQTGLFPTTTYHFNSGGDPAHIPELSYEQLKRFHAAHYHPSNAVLMTYGNFPLRDHQAHFHDWALKRFKQEDFDIGVGEEQRFDSPRRLSAPYAVDPGMPLEAQTHFIVGWLMGSAIDVDEFLDAHMLYGLLLENSSSPLRHYLETTELARAPSELCGLDDSSRQLVFCCGVEGTEAAHAAALERGIIEVLERVVREGIGTDVIEAVLDQIEMAQRDTDGDGFPHGLQLLGRLLAPAIHGADPAALLDLDPALARLRQRALEPGFVAALLRGALLDNPHRLSVTMTPDADLAEAQRDAEHARLAQLREQLDAATLDEIRQRARQLVERQNQQDDPEVLPSLTLADVPAAMDFAASESFTAGAYRGRQADCAANGIVTAQLWYPLPALDERSLELLPLLADYAAELGSGSAAYLEVQERRARIGAFDVFASARSATGDAAALTGHLVVSGKALERKAPALVEELLALLPMMRIDESVRIAELVAQTRAEAEGDVVDRGHALAMYAASALLSPGGWLDDHWDGLGALRFIKQLDQSLGGVPGAAAALGGELGALRDGLIETRPEVVLVGAANALRQMHGTLADRPGAAAETARPERLAAPAAAASRRIAFRASTSVNFCARAVTAVAEAHADTPALMVLGRYLHHGYLHRAVREQGGAYGSGAGYDADSGTFRFFSYRDPRLEATLEDFDNAVDWLLSSHDAGLLEEAILGTVRALDAPRAPAAAALRDIAQARYGRGPEFLRKQREAVLKVGIEALHEVARRYLKQDSATAVVTDAAGSQRLVAGGYTVTEL